MTTVHVPAALGRRPVAVHGFSLLEMLVAIVIMGVSIALIYRSLGDGASKAADLLQRHKATLLLEGLLQTPPDRLPYPVPQQGTSGDLAWRIEPATDVPQPQLLGPDVAPGGAGATAAAPPPVRPQALRYTVWWGDGRRQISVVTWRLAPTAGQGAP